jgi:hypothetical protein
MLNKTTMLQRVGIHMIVDRLMVASRTNAIRGIPVAQSIEITPDLSNRLSGPTSNFAITPSTAAGEIQPDTSNDSDSFGGRPRKPSTKPSSDRNNTKPKHPNPTPNRTYHGVLRPLPHAG